MKKFVGFILVLAMILSLCACGGTESNNSPVTIGICQLVQHDALDAATKGFKDAVEEEFKNAGKTVTFNEQNAAGDSATCSTICNQFVSEGVDLIMANATPALQAASSCTKDIPILGTSVTEYGVALEIDNFSGTVGGNISGTSDLAPLDGQAAMVKELFPDVQNVSIIYCSAEANSVYQVKVLTEELEKLGVTVASFSFSDSNDVAVVCSTACANADVLFIPTDNVAASCAETIGNVAEPLGVPIICGDENPCAICGVAALSIDYYNLGITTGKMAAKILLEGKDISTMPIEYFPNPVKKYNSDMAAKYGLTIPDDYVAIG